MDLSNSVIMPRDDFIELQTVAWSQTPTPLSERVGTTVQTLAFCVIATAAFAGGTVVWVKANDWLEERRDARADRKANRYKK